MRDRTSIKHKENRVKRFVQSKIIQDHVEILVFILIKIKSFEWF